jgi:transposase
LSAYACRVFGFCSASLWRYIKEYKEIGEESFVYKKRGVKLRTGSKLSESQERELVRDILENTPDELGLDYTLWTSKVLKEYIIKKFNVNYARRSIRDLVVRLGFSSQKPIKFAYQRDPKKIEKWLNEIYPKIKIRASQEGARIYWGDEMGVQSTDNRGRTYGLKGKTPQIKKTGSRFKCNMLAAISPQGFMNWMVFENSFTSKKFIEFLGRMKR